MFFSIQVLIYKQLVMNIMLADTQKGEWTSITYQKKNATQITINRPVSAHNFQTVRDGEAD